MASAAHTPPPSRARRMRPHWLKLYHPVEFGCGLLNNQPMGFYHPSVLVEDLNRHGVTVRPVDVNLSDVRCLPEPLQRSPSHLTEGPPSSTRPALPPPAIRYQRIQHVNPAC